MTAAEPGSVRAADRAARARAGGVGAGAAGRPSRPRRSRDPGRAKRSAGRRTRSTRCCARLDDGDWRTPALRGLDIQGLVGHLIGVEDDAHRCLAGDPEVAGVSHVESTQAAATAQGGRPPPHPGRLAPGC